MFCIPFAAISAFETDPVGDDYVRCRNDFCFYAFSGSNDGETFQFFLYSENHTLSCEEDGGDG